MGNHEVIPGMAAAIEARRVERFHTVKDFAAAAGVSESVLADVRRGHRKRYAGKVKAGVARALEWPVDALDRLMRGEHPSTFPTVGYDEQGRVRGETPPPLAVEVQLATLRAQVDALQRRLDRLDQQHRGT